MNIMNSNINTFNSFNSNVNTNKPKSIISIDDGLDKN